MSEGRPGRDCRKHKFINRLAARNGAGVASQKHAQGILLLG